MYTRENSDKNIGNKKVESWKIKKSLSEIHFNFFFLFCVLFLIVSNNVDLESSIHWSLMLMLVIRLEWVEEKFCLKMF